MKKNIKNNIKNNSIISNKLNLLRKNKFLLLLFFMFMLLCCFFPYSGDDFAWGTQIGLDRLNNWFYNYNGRYAGNLLILLLSRSKTLRVIIETVIFTLIVKYMNKVVNKDNTTNIFISILLLFMMPITIFRQTVAWASGFSNYVIPILIILVIINDNISLLDDKKVLKENNIYKCIFFLILGFLGSLFIENITLYNIVLIILILIYEKIKNKKLSISNIAYFIGSLIGTIGMFSNKAYLSILNNNDGYRTVAKTNIIISSLKTFVKTLVDYIFIDNIIVEILLGICLILLIYKYKKGTKKLNNKNSIIINISMFFILTYIFNIVYIKLPFNDKIFLTDKYNYLINAAISLMMVLSLIMIIIVCIRDNFKKRKILFYVASLIVFNAPLVVITPIGPRLFLTTYIFYILIIIELLDYLYKDKLKQIEKPVKTLIIIAVLYLGIIYYTIHIVDVAQYKYIEKVKEKNLSTIVLPLLPHSKYLHCVNMTDETFGYRYKLYHGIDNNVLVSYTPYTNWVKTIGQAK